MSHTRQAPVSSDQLTRPDDVIAHLAYAAATIQDATVTLRGAALRCRMGFPDAQSRTNTVCLAMAPLERPEAGAVVEVSYARGPNSFKYLTSIRSVRSDSHWTLHAPTVIDRIERRQTRRVNITNNPDFELTIEEGQGPGRGVALRDLSPAGVSFEVPTALPWARPGATVRGSFTLAGGDTLPVTLHIRNRRAQQRGMSTVLGAQFIDPAPALAARITHALTKTQGS